MKRLKGIVLVSIIVLASFLFFGAYNIPPAKANPGSNLWNSFGKSHTSSGITVSNPTKAYDETFNASAASFQYSAATGYFSITDFENATTYLGNPLPTINQVDFKIVYNATANAGDLSDKYRIVYYVGGSAAQVLTDWRTDNYTYLGVNGFDDSKPYWVTTGSTPYLDAVNYPTSYISESNDGGIIGDFTFQNTAGTYDTLKLQTYATLTGSVQNQIRVWLYDETQKRYRSAEFDLIVPTTTWGWVGPEFDFASLLNTVTKINNAKLYLEKAGSGSTVLVDAMRFLGQNSTTVRPDGNGAFTSWIEDYTQWDETVHDSNTTYVYATGPNLDESSTLSDAPGTDTWSIAKVRLTIIARQTTGDEQVQLMLVRDGTKYLGSTWTPTRDFATYTSEWDKDPSDGNPWTWADINAFEAGVRSLQYGGAWSGEMRVTQMYLEVFSSEAPLPVDGFDNSKKWTRVGASPYLGAVDNPTNILQQTIGDAVIGDFSFADFTGAPPSKTYGKVYLEVYSTQTLDVESKRDDYIEVGLFNATTNDYTPVATIVPGAAYSWVSSADLSLLYLRNAFDINNAKFELVKKSVGLESQISVDAVRLKVWNEGSAPEAVTLTWENKPEPNDDAWSWNDIKKVRFAVETSKAGAADLGCMFYLSEAWLTLTLPDAMLKVGPQKFTSSSGPVSQILRPNEEGTFSELFSSGGQKPYRPATLGNGLYTGWFGTESDWDDTPFPPAIYNDGDASKVNATSGGLQETSTFSISTQAWTIAKIKVTIVARQTTGDEQVQIMIRASSTDSFGLTYTPPALGTGTVSVYENYYSSEWATNPATGLAWQWSDITTASYLQAGVKSIQNGGTFDGQLRVTFIFMDIMPDNHYTFWDEATANGDTDYLYATSAVFNGYGRESSNLQPSGAPAWLPASVKIVVNATTTDGASDDKFYLTAVIAGKQYMVSSLILPTTTYLEYSYNLVFNPATNAPWTWAEIDAVEVGVRTERVGASFTGTMKFTQLYVVVLGPRYDADVFVQDVWDLYGYTFVLRYNTSALTALGAIIYSPMNWPQPGTAIDDTAGTIALSYSLPGQPKHAEGFSGNTTLVTLSKIIFQGDSVGSSALDLYPYHALSSTLAVAIEHTVVDGAHNDIKVTSVVPSATTLTPGTAYSVDVTVKNEGNFTESFGVAAKYNATYDIGGTQVNNLAPNTQTTVSIPWTPTNMPSGKYNVTATITDRYPSPTMNQIVDESDTSDNALTYQWVTVLAHDIAITSVSTATVAYNGTAYRRNIYVTVKNEGDFTESFNVTAYYDTFRVVNWTSGLGYETVSGLAAGASKTVSIEWNSTVPRFGKELGNYTIWAEISTSSYGKKVQYEVDTTDNHNTFAQPVTITKAGDVDGDNDVDRFDFGTFAGAYGGTEGPPPSPNWNPNADIDGDGSVTRFDFGIFAGNYGKSWVP